MRTQPSILHVDLDAFYASVEQLHKPSLRGKPVVVGGVGVRGVVSTASYEARAFGVHSALATGIARRRAPNAAYLIPRFGAYQAYSEVVMALMHDLSPLVEPLSMDEAFVDVGPLLTTARDPIESSREVRGVAAGLRARIREATGLTASVGAGSSKLIAKIASDADKPDGLVVVEPGPSRSWLDPQPVRALWGVGPATAERLRRVGATTVAELRTLSEGELVAVLGSAHGGMLYAVARGQDDREVHTEREMKSISVEDTFATDLLDPSAIHAEMDRLVGRLATRLRRAGRTGRTITIKVRGHDFTTVSRSETAAGPTDDPAAIRAATRRMLPGAVQAATRDTPGVRLLGVGVSGLADWAQAELFGEVRRGARTRSSRPARRATGLPGRLWAGYRGRAAEVAGTAEGGSGDAAHSGDGVDAADGAYSAADADVTAGAGSADPAAGIDQGANVDPAAGIDRPPASIPPTPRRRSTRSRASGPRASSARRPPRPGRTRAGCPGRTCATTSSGPAGCRGAASGA